jgi:homoserine dehydrogenase
MKKQIGIGLMGFGIIGSSTARVLTNKNDSIAKQAYGPLVLKKILETDKGKYGTLGINRELFTGNLDEIIGNPEIDIVIELIGGEQPAFEYISQALSAGKHIVTANKEVMAKHGFELLALARNHQVDIRYEASVGGGIPLIAPF